MTHKIDKLAMPRLGYGLDKLNWSEVRRMFFFYIFEDLNMYIQYSFVRCQRKKT
nr:unnamed protein product [Callosobruchus analis]